MQKALQIGIDVVTFLVQLVVGWFGFYFLAVLVAYWMGYDVG